MTFACMKRLSNAFLHMAEMNVSNKQGEEETHMCREVEEVIHMCRDVEVIQKCM